MLLTTRLGKFLAKAHMVRFGKLHTKRQVNTITKKNNRSCESNEVNKKIFVNKRRGKIIILRDEYFKGT